MFPGQPSHRISIHAPREGGDVKMPTIPKGILRFQSTPPARGATTKRSHHFFKLLFQSTPPARGATNKGVKIINARPISIHAPREGGDSKDAQFYL